MSADPRIPAYFTTIDEDLEAAEVLIARGNRLAAFHMEQAIEKLAKVALIARGVEGGIEHHIDVLLNGYPKTTRSAFACGRFGSTPLSRRRSATRSPAVACRSRRRRTSSEPTSSRCASTQSELASYSCPRARRERSFCLVTTMSVFRVRPATAQAGTTRILREGQLELFWIDKVRVGRLATATRPRGGDWLDDDIRHVARNGVALLVSMLTPPECVELGLRDEATAARAAGLSFMNLPIEDRGLPERVEPFLLGVGAAVDVLRFGGGVAVHCRMGVGRSSMFAASVLVKLGVEPADAWNSIAAVRGRPVPDVAKQREWVDGMRAMLRAP